MTPRPGNCAETALTWNPENSSFTIFPAKVWDNFCFNFQLDQRKTSLEVCSYWSADPLSPDTCLHISVNWSDVIDDVFVVISAPLFCPHSLTYLAMQSLYLSIHVSYCEMLSPFMVFHVCTKVTPQILHVFTQLLPTGEIFCMDVGTWNCFQVSRGICSLPIPNIPVFPPERLNHSPLLTYIIFLIYCSAT